MLLIGNYKNTFFRKVYIPLFQQNYILIIILEILKMIKDHYASPGVGIASEEYAREFEERVRHHTENVVIPALERMNAPCSLIKLLNHED